MPYKPINWVVIRVDSTTHGTYFKLLGMWSPHNDMPWRINSGITKVVDNGNSYDVHGYSGSIYMCPKDSEKLPNWMEPLMLGIANQGGKIVSIQECIGYLKNNGETEVCN